MKALDLIPYAEHSQKLPEKVLEPVSTPMVWSWKILIAHTVDFGMAFATTMMMTQMFNQFVKLLLLTRTLKLAYSEAFVLGLAAPLFPIMLFSYFFFSYFFNDGQTYGMHLMKNRIDLKSKSFRAAFRWATHSAFLCFTGGLTYLFQRNVWKAYKHHDFLYENLMSHKVFKSINLVVEAEKNTLENSAPETWSKAA
jgi:hypothetical protein